MRIAVVLTVKNESVLLPRCIEFHQLVGITDFFVYYDHGSEKTAIPDTSRCKVAVRYSVGRADFPENELNYNVINKLLCLSEKHHTARQMLNAHHAILLAREAGIDWIVSIDADEIVYPFDSIGPGESLKDFLRRIEPATAVRFLPIEVCPRADNTNDPIFELTEFLNIFRKMDGKYRPDIPISKAVYDPYHKEQVMLSGYIGHRAGKVAVRPVFHVEPDTVHSFRFRNEAECIQLETLGLLHYNHYSFDDFLKKYQNFRQRPDRYAYGERVEYFPKLLWRDMVNDPGFSEEQLRDYYERYITWSDEDMARLKVMNPCPIVSINSPRRLLREARER